MSEKITLYVFKTEGKINVTKIENVVYLNDEPFRVYSETTLESSTLVEVEFFGICKVVESEEAAAAAAELEGPVVVRIVSLS